MQDIRVTRYAHPKATGWAGYIQPADRSWIAFVGLDGRPVFFLHRDPVTGAVLPDDPAERESALADLARGGVRTGQAVPPEHVGDEPASPLEAGETCYPLGVDGTGGLGVEPLTR